MAKTKNKMAKIVRHEEVLRDLFELFFHTEKGYDPDKDLDSDVLGEAANLLWPLAGDFAGEDAVKFKE